ncbi:MAG TPA: PAS domain S-box protein [Spirochaetia bacterium]|nr:PAS domain S-box protein [Spirochaetales bacterium]HRY80388.1 PAS domain S-box protein [Spirochaetia bacterium]HRZ88884.1 PAS domain S-box protein [Spirochaetia bacterium]
MPAPKKLLLVEDEAVIALAEARVLGQSGYDVEIVHTGEASVEAIRSDPAVDLVLMDIDLGPGLSGPDAAARILELRSLPIVFLTSHSEREMVDKVRNITRYGYVVKNSGGFVLLSSIELAFELFSAHEEVRRQSRRREAMLQAIPDLIFSVDRDGTIRDFHAPPGVGLAVPEERVAGTNIREILPPGEAERHLALYRTCLETGEVLTDSYSLNPDGRIRIYELRLARQDENQVLAVVRNVTDRIESERQLRRVTAHYEYLFDCAPVPIVLLDGEDRVVKVNANFLRTFGYSQEEAVGRPINDLVVPPEHGEEGRDYSRRVASGEPLQCEAVRRRKDGSRIRVSITASLIELEGSFYIYAIYQPVADWAAP